MKLLCFLPFLCENNPTVLRHRHFKTSLILYALMLYLIPSFALQARGDASLAAWQAWAGNPFNAFFLAGLLSVGFYHFAYCLDVMAEDYITEGPARRICLWVLRFACTTTALFGLVALGVLVWRA